MGKRKDKEPVFTVTKTRTYVTPATEYDGPTMTGEEAGKKLMEGFNVFSSYIDSPTYKARAAFTDLVMGVPDLGVMQLSLTQAADLVAADMWLSGETDIEGPDVDDIDRHDPVLMELLKDLRANLTAQLVVSVADKSLETTQLRMELLTGRVNPATTFVAHSALDEWLLQHEYQPGDWFNDYSEEEGKIYSELVDELYVIRARYAPTASEEEASLQRLWRSEASGISLGIYPDPEQASIQTLREIVKRYSVELARLNRELGNRVSGDDVRALTPKGRKTLHRLIAALCVEAKVNPADRGAATTLTAITQRAGLPVGDDTIRKILGELPEAKRDR